MLTVFSWLPDSDNEELKENFLPSNMPVPTISLSWEYAWACKSPLSNTLVTCCTWTEPIPRKWRLKTKYPVIDLMESQKEVTDKGGTMRLGAYKCVLKEGSKAIEAYGTKDIEERHRHRYEFNGKYTEQFEQAGMITTGVNPDTGLTEIVEIPTHKWFVGTQFHPEYKSTVTNPHPLFVAFVKACLS